MKITIDSLAGNRQRLDGGAMFGNAPKAIWAKHFLPDAENRIELACRAMLIRTEREIILCETGIGCFFEPKLAARFGVVDTNHQLLESLAEIGVKQTDVSCVILSHLHFDHAGGLLPSFAEITAGNDQLLFPNARYVVGKDAWDRACHPHIRDRASFIPGLTDKLRASGRLDVMTAANPLSFVGGRVRFRQTEGHTVGHLHAIVRGDHRTVIFAGDLIPGTAWINLPMTMGYDRYPEQLINEKRELYTLAVAENWLIFLTHDPAVAAATVHESQVAGRFEVGEVHRELREFVL